MSSLAQFRRNWKLKLPPTRKVPQPHTAAVQTSRAVTRLASKVPSFGGAFHHLYHGGLPPHSTRVTTITEQLTGAGDERKQIYHHHGDGGGQTTTDDEVWEEEEEVDEAEPEIGDGGDGGGVELRGVGWGERALAIARDVLDRNFDTQDMSIFAFKVSPKGYVYVRLDKLSHKYGCPSIDEIECFNILFKDQLEESGKLEELPDNLAVEVSSPGALRLLKVPDDLERFKDIPLVVNYLEEDAATKILNKGEGIFFLDSIDSGKDNCTWKLADVKENRSPSRKGRPLSRKRKEWRLTIPFVMIKRVTFYVSF